MKRRYAFPLLLLFCLFLFPSQRAEAAESLYTVSYRCQSGSGEEYFLIKATESGSLADSAGKTFTAPEIPGFSSVGAQITTVTPAHRSSSRTDSSTSVTLTGDSSAAESYFVTFLYVQTGVPVVLRYHGFPADGGAYTDLQSYGSAVIPLGKTLEPVPPDIDGYEFSDVSYAMVSGVKDDAEGHYHTEVHENDPNGLQLAGTPGTLRIELSFNYTQAKSRSLSYTVVHTGYDDPAHPEKGSTPLFSGSSALTTGQAQSFTVPSHDGYRYTGAQVTYSTGQEERTLQLDKDAASFTLPANAVSAKLELSYGKLIGGGVMNIYCLDTAEKTALLMPQITQKLFIGQTYHPSAPLIPNYRFIRMEYRFSDGMKPDLAGLGSNELTFTLSSAPVGGGTLDIFFYYVASTPETQPPATVPESVPASTESLPVPTETQTESAETRPASTETLGDLPGIATFPVMPSSAPDSGSDTGNSFPTGLVVALGAGFLIALAAGLVLSSRRNKA